MSRILPVTALLLATLLLGGCLASSGPAVRYYLINPLAQPVTPPPGGRQLVVEVADVRLPQYLERPQLVTRSDANRLELAEFHQWGGNLRKDLTRVLAKNLAELLATPSVTIPPHHTPLTPDARVEVEVMAFERGADGFVRLSVQWRIQDGAGRPLTTRFSDFTSATAYAADDFDGTVAAMGELFAQLSRTIASAIGGGETGG